MRVRRGCPTALLVAAAAALFANGKLLADSVRLDGGGSLTGSVTTGAKAVTVKTASGAVIVFERNAVKQVVRGYASSSKISTVATTTTSRRSQPKRHVLTLPEEAWVHKIRTLVSWLSGSDREKAARARRALGEIDDNDAIIALSTYVGSNRNVDIRHLYVVALHNMSGPRPVYYLVALSLFDPSPLIRSEARRTFRDDQLDSARVLYIDALRSGVPSLARQAALALGEVGDPRGDSVPYLIDALVSYGTISRLKPRGHSGAVLTDVAYEIPGLKLLEAGKKSEDTDADRKLKKESEKTPPAADSDSEQPEPAPTSLAGLASGHAALPPSAGPTGSASTAKPSTSSSLPMGPMIEDDSYYDPPSKCKKHSDTPLSGYVDHPEVLDALVKITDMKYPGYGFDRDRWRTWWSTEKTNRALQPPPDHVVAGP
jgi:hypothetical protein